MQNKQTGCQSGAVLLAFVGGVVAGVMAGLLLAPQAGEETRRALQGYAKRKEEELIEKAKEARAALQEAIDQGRQLAAETRADVAAAVKERMNKCCS
ncbi:MAG TPA: YtxH domain-containing protein [Nitrospira sp.]|nr:YtxH domain-containing protein [Nitrospira sp.]